MKKLLTTFLITILLLIGVSVYSQAGFLRLSGGALKPVVKSWDFGSTDGVLWFDSTNTGFYVGFRATTTLATNTVWILPSEDGTSSYALLTDGNKNLYFADVSIHDPVTLNTTSYDYLSLSAQEITLGQINIGDDTDLGTTTNIIYISGSDLGINETQIDHDNLLNYLSNEHIDWTAQLAGTIDLSNLNLAQGQFYVGNSAGDPAGTSSIFMNPGGGINLLYNATGVSPVQSAHLATKEYVDTAVGVSVDYFLSDTVSDVGGYNKMFTDDTGEAESSVASTSLGAGNDQFVFGFISTTTPVTTLSAGTYGGHLHAEKTDGTRSLQFYWTLSSWTTSSVETVLLTSEVSSLISSKVAFDLHAATGTDIELNPDDRILIKVYANIGSSGSAVDATIYMEGAVDSHISVPSPFSAFSNIFLRNDGTTPLTANWGVGGFNIFNIGTASTTNLIVEASTTAFDLIATGNITFPIAWTGFLKATNGIVGTSTVDISDDTDLTAGDHLTLNDDDMDLDSEIFTESFSIVFKNATITENGFTQHSLPNSITITEVSCFTNTSTINVQLDERASTTPGTGGTDIMNAALVCDTNTESTTTFANAGIDNAAKINLDIDAIGALGIDGGITVFYTIDD